MTAGVRNFLIALTSGEWDLAAILARGKAACGTTPRFARPFVKRLLDAFPAPPDFATLAAFAAADPKFARGSAKIPPAPRQYFFVRETMTPRGPALNWPVPPIDSATDLAAWLGIPPERLAWFADPANRNPRDGKPKLLHYAFHWLPKANGRWRLVEAPKSELKSLQRFVLWNILNRIPPHAAAHGFRRGRNIRTFAAPHVGRDIVLRVDLTDFFAAVARGRVRNIFRTAGYPEAVANLLAGLCTAATPRAVWDTRPHPAADGSDHAACVRFRTPHLPQGAATSPALANLAAFRLDSRLAGYAAAAGAAYTRYADDLAFSGDDVLLRSAAGFLRRVWQICVEEGFTPNAAKTRVMPRSGRQQLAGVVVNATPNTRRTDFDTLKAILTNCARTGPAAENRAGHPDFRAHLAGKIAHAGMLNPARGAKLRAIFARIAWPPPPPAAQ